MEVNIRFFPVRAVSFPLGDESRSYKASAEFGVQRFLCLALLAAAAFFSNPASASCVPGECEPPHCRTHYLWLCNQGGLVCLSCGMIPGWGCIGRGAASPLAGPGCRLCGGPCFEQPQGGAVEGEGLLAALAAERAAEPPGLNSSMTTPSERLAFLISVDNKNPSDHQVLTELLDVNPSHAMILLGFSSAIFSSEIPPERSMFSRSYISPKLAELLVLQFLVSGGKALEPGSPYARVPAADWQMALPMTEYIETYIARHSSGGLELTISSLPDPQREKSAGAPEAMVTLVMLEPLRGAPSGTYRIKSINHFAPDELEDER